MEAEENLKCRQGRQTSLLATRLGQRLGYLTVSNDRDGLWRVLRAFEGSFPQLPRIDSAVSGHSGKTDRSQTPAHPVRSICEV